MKLYNSYVRPQLTPPLWVTLSVAGLEKPWN